MHGFLRETNTERVRLFSGKFVAANEYLVCSRSEAYAKAKHVFGVDPPIHGIGEWPVFVDTRDTDAGTRDTDADTRDTDADGDQCQTTTSNTVKFAEGQKVSYAEADGKQCQATIIHVDYGIKPVSYMVQFANGSVRSTEAARVKLWEGLANQTDVEAMKAKMANKAAWEKQEGIARKLKPDAAFQ